ncbi:MAG: DUF4922 domain-containing protein [Paludibacteraceae bacterium]
MSLQHQINTLFDEQLRSWPLAANNFADLTRVEVKTCQFDDFVVRVQFNPARMVSSGAKVDAKSIAERPCFLCRDNRPAEQHAVAWGNYEILVNPYPIFPRHFTIPLLEHQPQNIDAHFADMLQLAALLPELVVFYNGPRCGASAPDHMHFQAGAKHFLPLIDDYDRLKTRNAIVYDQTGSATTFSLSNYLRTVFCIEGRRADAVQIAFMKLYNLLLTEPLVEPMMNVIATCDAGLWRVFVLPRALFRPWQYSTENADKQLLVSPATVEMAGVFVTPVQGHFERIATNDIVDIFNQTTRKI